MLTEELKVCVYDIEVFAAMFLYCGHNLSTDTKHQYEISRRKNELYTLVKHLKDRKFDYGVGYNCISYDSQILQYILDSYEHWHDLSSDQILQLIYSFSQETISRSNYELQPIYREQYLDIPQIDLFRTHHYDNKNRRVGLKTLEFAMNMPNIQEIPVDWKQPYLTDEELDITILYCWNDVDSTEMFWNITIGNTENELYKGKDMIQARLDTMEEIGFDHRCLSWSNSKIGDEINKKGYMQETGCSVNDLYKKKKERKPTPAFTFDSCIPSYVKFRSKEMNDLRKQVSGIKVSLSKDDQEFIVKYGNTTYSIMRGGIHSHDGPRILESNDNYLIYDADIGGQYPRTIVKRNLYPSHLGEGWLKMYEKQGVKRSEFKKRIREGPKYKGLSETWKDVLNAGGLTIKLAV